MGIATKRKEADFVELNNEEVDADVPDFFEAQQNIIEKNLAKHRPPQFPIESVE